MLCMFARPAPTGALAFLLLLCSAVAIPATAQSPPTETPSAPPSFKLLASQVTEAFPVVRTDVIEVVGPRITLGSGRRESLQAGLSLDAYREGRELFHPRTKKLLGRAEQPLGRLVVTEVFDGYSVAILTDPTPGAALRPGDKARVAAGKIRLTLVTLTTGPRSQIVETAVYALAQELEQTGRFQIAFGDQIAAWLTQERVKPEDFMQGQRVRAAAEQFKVSHLLAVHFTTVQDKPLMNVRLFAAAVDRPLVQNALFVPRSIRVQPGQQFSTGPGGTTARLERRSLLEKLLSGDFEPYKYSAGAAAIPVRELATFPFTVISMDVAVGPHDKLPRIALTDGQRVFLYRLRDQTLEPEWTHDKLMVGRILSVQLADLNGDGVLDVVVNRQDVKSGMLSYILTTRSGKAALLAEDIPLILLAVDEKGDGVNKTLWGQRYSPQKFWTAGTAERLALKKDDVTPTGRVIVHAAFRPSGATFVNIAGKERVMAFVDEYHRLTISGAVGQELWRSNTAVGGGLAQGQIQIDMLQTVVDKFFKWEPNPVAVDLDGDGTQEIVVPINEDEAGRMAVIFRGPAGYRMQVVSSGFEGFVTGLGAIPGETPSLVAAVVKRSGIWRSTGDTQLIMTVPE